ncbi:uncharacterized protein LOC124446330 [Xenia sp. Carnegie-2017]|uniref:uncharacterized protein LOC124446330 n=1 Tax=Xenia sp. Carnegie-2017 TaxID=2897299 RepID=UPI001F0435FC|nr:uncharacterized protein LOC124446330 [Xenia sp. Carnegie-2017]
MERKPLNEIFYHRVGHSDNLLETMYKSYKESNLCDITLIVSDGEIKTHKLILSSFSLYFEDHFHFTKLQRPSGHEDEPRDVVDISNFNKSTIECIIDYAYTGKMKFTKLNVMPVLKASDYFQLQDLSDIRKWIANDDFIQEFIDDSNFLSWLVFAEKYQMAELLENVLMPKVAKRFYKIAQSEEFFSKLDVNLLKQILQCDAVVVDFEKDFLPSAEVQEDFILEVVLKYVSLNAKSDNIDIMLSELLPGLCYHSLSSQCKEKFEQFISHNKCDGTMKAIKQAEESGANEGADDDAPALWRSERNYSHLVFKCHKIHAGNAHVGPEKEKFGIEMGFTNLFITGMKIVTRLWDGRHVIGGIMVFYNNSEVELCHYGMSEDEGISVYEFHLSDDERIVKAEINSGWMIDRLKFITNKGTPFGPYGGNGGSLHVEKPRSDYGYLSFLKGSVVTAQHQLAITKLELCWGEYSPDNAHGKDINDDGSLVACNGGAIVLDDIDEDSSDVDSVSDSDVDSVPDSDVDIDHESDRY